MRASLLLAARRLAVATVLACPGPVPGRAQTAARDPHAHPNGPHQTLPLLPGDRPVATVNAVPPTIPAAPPPVPVLPPPIVVPTRPVEPPPPPNVAADASGIVEDIANGLRITFGSGSADLNPATAAALRALAQATPPDRATFTIVATAAGTPDDPSTARRLSLSRGLAVRAVLIGQGVPSPRIYLRALGATAATAPGIAQDRADVTVAVAPPPAAAAPPGQPAPPQKAAP